MKKTIEIVKFAIATLIVNRKTKVPMAKKTGTDLWEGLNGNGNITLTDKEVYGSLNKENFFMNPLNAKGVARHILKYPAAKFPLYATELAGLTAGASIDNAEEKVNEIASAPIKVHLAKTKGKVVAPRTELKFRKDGTIDTRFKYAAGLVEAFEATKS